MAGVNVLSLITGGYQPSLLMPFVPADRLITIKGSLRDVLGQPVGRALVFFSPYMTPKFNLQDLLAAEARRVETDQEGSFSSTPQNQVRVLRSTTEEWSYVRMRMPAAGADWVFRMPRDLDLITLKDLVRVHCTVDLAMSS